MGEKLFPWETATQGWVHKTKLLQEIPVFASFSSPRLVHTWALAGLCALHLYPLPGRKRKKLIRTGQHQSTNQQSIKGDKMRDRPCHQAASRSLRPQYILYVQHLWQTTIISYHTYYVSTRLPESITQHHPSAFRTRTSCSELHTTYECPATLAAVYQAQGIRHLVLHTGQK